MMTKQIKPLPILQGKTAFAINLISQVSVIVAQMVISLFFDPDCSGENGGRSLWLCWSC